MPILEQAVRDVPGGTIGLFGAIDTEVMRPHAVIGNQDDATATERLIALGATPAVRDDETILAEARASLHAQGFKF